MVRIVHLSDFHLSKSTLSDFKRHCINPLMTDLKSFDNQHKIDLVIFSGDLIDKGGSSFGNIDEAFKAFEETVICPIINELHLPKERFIFVPGNHDIDRKSDSKIEEVGVLNTLTSRESVNEYYDQQEPNGRRRMLPFKNFEKNYFVQDSVEAFITPFHSNFIVTNDELRIGITGLNSSWRCYDSNEDKGRLIVGSRQMTESMDIIGSCDLKVAIIHHQTDWLVNFEKQDLEAALYKHYDLLFSGHVHEGTNWSTSNMYGNLFVSVAPANWSTDVHSNDRHFSNGYSIIDFSSESQHLVVHNRRYAPRKECFDPNTDLGDHDGRTYYQFPSQNEFARRQTQVQIVSRITTNYLDELNGHLLSFNTETQAPKDLEKIYVMPRVVEREDHGDYEGNQRKEHLFTLEELCSITYNLLIFGIRESGKTTLLDRILLELTKNFSVYRKVPIYLDFEQFKSTRVETALAAYLGISVIEIDRFLQENSVVLLLDNLSFSRSRAHILRKLIEFHNQYPDVIFLGTCTSIIEGEVPLDIFDYSFWSTVRMANLKPFKTKEIKALVQNWFSNNPGFYDSEKVRNIIRALTTLNIPSTPFAISMFLWIIEQQENYKPINNATMLENFVERLLKKASKNEIYAGQFDFKNKIRLLARIAYEMYGHNDVNYRMSKNDLRNFIHNYLQVRKFAFEDFDEVQILQHFVDKGLLLFEKDGYVRFRFSSFFKFFMMKNMEFDADFRTYVLKEENYLMFLDEIDYYTGLRRAEDDILKLIVERMNESYKDILQTISEWKHGFDEIFETKRTVASALTGSSVQKLIGKKPDETEIEQMQDDVLDNINPGNDIEKKDLELSQVEKLERTWVLSALVLKNTEDTEIPDLKSESFDRVVTCAMAYAVLYKTILTDFNLQHGSRVPNDQWNFMERLFPLLYQVFFYSTIGTEKLSLVIREFMDTKLNRTDVSDFEKFLLVYLYADLKLPRYQDYINKLFNNVKTTYIKDMLLFKTILYYYFRSTKSTERIYQGMIWRLISSAVGTGSESQRNAGQKFKKIKLQKVKKVHEDRIE